MRLPHKFNETLIEWAREVKRMNLPVLPKFLVSCQWCENRIAISPDIDKVEENLKVEKWAVLWWNDYILCPKCIKKNCGEEGDL